jgi:hypothetical protein
MNRTLGKLPAGYPARQKWLATYVIAALLPRAAVPDP